MLDKPCFSIIIPALNEEARLPVLLRSLAKQKDKDFELIVVDGGSTDKTEEEARKFEKEFSNFTYHKEKLKNVSASRNRGAKLARSDWLIFFDADVEVKGDFILKARQEIVDHNLDALTVWNRSKENSLTGKIILAFLNISMTLLQKIQPVVNGPCIIIKNELFKKINGFDENIVFGEDYDLIRKAKKAGMKFAVFRTPRLYVSTRRFEKEGLFPSLFKSIKAIIYQVLIGPIKKPIFEYKMGGQYYK